MFFVVALSLVLLATFSLARRLVGGLYLSGPKKGIALFGLVLLVVLMVTEPLRWRLGGGNEGALTRALIFSAYAAMGLFSLLFALTLAKDLTRLFARATALLRRRLERGPCDVLDERGLERRVFLARTRNGSILGAAGLLSAAGVHRARGGPELFRVDVPIRDLAAKLVVGGVPDIREAGRRDPAKAHDPKRAFHGAPEGVRLLLAHQPRSAFAAKGLGVDLVLSGHTHGGSSSRGPSPSTSRSRSSRGFTTSAR